MPKTVRTRSAAVCLVLGAILIVGLWLQPATAVTGTAHHLWVSYIRPRADDRYLQNTKTYITSFSIGAGASITADSDCPSGWQAIGGGVDFVSGAAAQVSVLSNAPKVNGDNIVAAADGRNPAPDGWRVKMHNNNGSGSYTGAVAAICSP
jgi:hypothetical protein